MPSLDDLLTWSFIAGLVPVLIFFLIYAFRTRWYEAMVGRVIFALAFVSVISYALSTATRLYPPLFDESESGVLFRVVARFVLAAIFWAVLIVFIRSQLRGRNRS